MAAKNRSLLGTIAVGFALGVPTAANACSKIGFHGMRSATMAHFIATPMADTVLAGAGSVRFVVAPGHFGPAGERTIFGQFVSIERIGGLAARTLRQPVDRVVLVPWDYGADCTPTPWTRSAAWAEPGTRGLFTGVLRDSAHWAGGVPTFDVFAPETEPYPQRVRPMQLQGRSLPSEMVPIEELFRLMELFPEQRLVPDSAEAATAALFAWARANPTLTDRYPIQEVLARARSMVGSQRLRAIESPLTGTYRMTVSLSGGAARTFYARTHRIPSSEWNAVNRVRRRVDDPTIVPQPDGYYLLAAVAQSIAALPETCEQRDQNREGYIAVVNARADATQARTWTGVLEVSLAERAFLGDSELSQFAKAAFDAYYRRSQAGLPVETPARFALSTDGTIGVEQRLTLDDGRSLTINGTRVSSDVVACRW